MTLPLYQAGLSAGTDIGSQLSLDAICGVLTAKTTPRTFGAVNPRTGDTARRVYCAARLYDVAVVVAARFR